MSDLDHSTRWKLPDASTVIAVLSLVISAITLVTVYMQTNHLGSQVAKMQEQTELAVNDTFYAKAFELQQIFIDRPELWPYFYHGKDPGSDTSAEQAVLLEVVSLLTLDYFDLIELIYREDLRMDQKDVAGTHVYMRHLINQSPVLRQTFDRYREWYPKLQPIFDETAQPPRSGG